MTAELIPIVHHNIADATVEAVNARDLHAFLGVGKDFSNWIKGRIQQYGFVEGRDYGVFAQTGENLEGGRPAKEYALSLDMAKELSMVERTERGRQARQYFIACEKKLRESTQPSRRAIAARINGLKGGRPRKAVADQTLPFDDINLLRDLRSAVGQACHRAVCEKMDFGDALLSTLTDYLNARQGRPHRRIFNWRPGGAA